MRGGETSGLRAYNERLIVSAVLRAGALSKAGIARETGLSGQAAAVIVNALIENGTLLKLPKVRGRIGQPSTPVAANPEGAYALGVKIGRRSVEAMLVDMLGDPVTALSETYAAPLPERTLALAAKLAADCLGRIGAEARGRVVGLGVAMPGDMHAWAAELGLPDGALDGWRDADVAGALREATGLEAAICNDATAACAAEMIKGDAIATPSALYVYLGMFIGGSVVIDGRLHRGAQLNAGAIGSMPSTTTDGSGRPLQLIHRASVLMLEEALLGAGLAQAEIGGPRSPAGDAVFESWLAEAAPEVARAVVAALSVIDFETVVVDGVLNPGWRTRFVAALDAEIGRFNRTGIAPAMVRAGSIGPSARVLGAAVMPLRARFSPDPDLLVRPASVSPAAGTG